MKKRPSKISNLFALTPVFFLCTVIGVGIAFSCNQKQGKLEKDTILRGETTIFTDESLLPIVQDQQLVFQTTYEAKLNVIPLSEKEVIQKLSQQKSGIAILSRKLTTEEVAFFKSHKIVPRTTAFALDGLALIRNNRETDSTIVLSDLITFLQGKNKAFKGVVFDNPNAASVRYMMEKASIQEFPKDGVYSMKNSQEVIKYVAEHEGMVGVVGSNWLFEPAAELAPYVAKVHELAVKGDKGGFSYPTQERIGTNNYPLARVLYIINCQGYEGLGIGFASFIAGDKGQRIVLKSGIAPVRDPGRKIVTRNKI